MTLLSKWREPDAFRKESHHTTAVWYEGEGALGVENADALFIVTRYERMGSEQFTTTFTTLFASDVFVELQNLGVRAKSTCDLYRWIAGVGVYHMQRFGGSTGEATELPR